MAHTNSMAHKLSGAHKLHGRRLAWWHAIGGLWQVLLQTQGWRAGLRERGALPELCVNDLEQPAFDVLPSLLQLKERLREESEGRFTAVFMTGMSTFRIGLGKAIHILFPRQGCMLHASLFPRQGCMLHASLFPCQGCMLHACLLLDSCCGHAAFSLCTYPGCMGSASV